MICPNAGPLGRTVEVGCGAGSESLALARQADGLVLTDLSLRAVLLARDRASDANKPLIGAVMDAENLALREGACERRLVSAYAHGRLRRLAERGEPAPLPSRASLLFTGWRAARGG